MNPRISFVLQMSPSTSYENLESIARSLLEGFNVLLDSEHVKCSVFLDGPMIETLYNVAKPLMFGKIQNAIRNGVLEFLGGGYYDTFLPRVPAKVPRIALAFSCQVVDTLPVEAHDCGVHCIVTERGMIRCVDE